MKSCLKLKDLTCSEIIEILKLAKAAQEKKFEGALKGKIVANLFFEPSTRTQYSFNVAQERLGCKVITFNPSTSSLQKGESFYDTVKTFESFGVDALVIRDGMNEYYKQLEGKIKCPILNAGDGSKDHPSQSLLDLYTIYEEFQRFEGLRIAIVGDIKNSRVAHTNIEVMKRLGMEVFTSGPSEFAEEQYEHVNFEDAIEEMDIIMLLRVQHERHEDEMTITKQRYHEQYGLTYQRMQKMKSHAIILHPAPFNRNVEIADEVVECEKSRIFKQMENGVVVRMALLLRALGGTK